MYIDRSVRGSGGGVAAVGAPDTALKITALYNASQEKHHPRHQYVFASAVLLLALFLLCCLSEVCLWSVGSGDSAGGAVGRADGGSAATDVRRAVGGRAARRSHRKHGFV